MREDGYTLAETMAAMLILGLAFAGLTQGVQVISRFQRVTGAEIAQDRSWRQIQAALERVVLAPSARGGDLHRSLKGAATAFSYACGQAAPCSAEILESQQGASLSTDLGDGPVVTALPEKMGALRFVYLTRKAAYDHWPLEDRAQKLVAISLLSQTLADDTPLATVRVWIEQPKACEYDMIARDCRAPGL